MQTSCEPNGYDVLQMHGADLMHRMSLQFPVLTVDLTRTSPLTNTIELPNTRLQNKRGSRYVQIFSPSKPVPIQPPSFFPPVKHFVGHVEMLSIGRCTLFGCSNLLHYPTIMMAPSGSLPAPSMPLAHVNDSISSPPSN